ncbi:hypothetical protein [Bradyrhizobium diazoefficiens]
MAATTNPADKSFSVVIEHLLEKATPNASARTRDMFMRASDPQC